MNSTKTTRTTLVVLTLGITALASCMTDPDRNPGDTDWPVYLGDSARSHFSPLQQITRNNVDQLTLAWRYDSGSLKEDESGLMYTSPLVIDGVLYGLSPKLVPFALDAATGKELWRVDLGLVPGAQRGLMSWRSDTEHRIFFTAGAELVALDARSGQPVQAFGKNGRLDLTPADPRSTLKNRGGAGVTVPGVVFKDLLIFGFSTNEDAQARPGSIRAFSAVDGRLVWQFDTVPQAGQPGSETWADGALDLAGGANVWTGMTLDEQREMLFAPTGSATPDFYGAKRLGDNLFANCLLALDANTGTLKWHYQVVRHDLWDRDNPSPPTLVEFEKNGKHIEAVAMTTKSGHLYVFDRDSGESIYPLIEVPGLPSTLPGEVPAATQRVSSVAISRQQFEITNRTPEARAFVEKQIKGWDQRPWAPPKVGTVLFYPWFDGGGEWGGSAFDPASNQLIVNANDAAGVLTLHEIPVGTSNYGTYATQCGSCHGLVLEGTESAPPLRDLFKRRTLAEVIDIVGQGRGRMPAFQFAPDEGRRILTYIASPEPEVDEPSKAVDYAMAGYVYLKDHEGLPGNSPPWGTLNAVDLATGNINWKIPFGDFPSHPGLGFGAVSYGGPVVTATGLVFIAATPDKMMRAYDARSGEMLWQYELTAAGFSTPITYSVGGKQFVVISGGGGRQGPPSGSAYYAFSLP